MAVISLLPKKQTEVLDYLVWNLSFRTPNCTASALNYVAYNQWLQAWCISATGTAKGNRNVSMKLTLGCLGHSQSPQITAFISYILPGSFRGHAATKQTVYTEGWAWTACVSILHFQQPSSFWNWGKAPCAVFELTAGTLMGLQMRFGCSWAISTDGTEHPGSVRTAAGSEHTRTPGTAELC